MFGGNGVTGAVLAVGYLCVVSGQWNVYWQKTFVQRTI